MTAFEMTTTRTGFRRTAAALLVASGWVAVAACGSENDATYLAVAPVRDVGLLSVPLETVSNSGTRYRLSASLGLSGPSSTQLSLSGEGTVVQTELQSGRYTATLLDGWQLSRVGIAGQLVPVAAELISPNPSSIDITPAQTSDLVLRFRAGNDVIPADDGTIRVVVDVEDPPPAETPCGLGAGLPCLDEVVESHLEEVLDNFDCIPAQQLSTPLGNVRICESDTCFDGTPGCFLPRFDFNIDAEKTAEGVALLASARFIDPFAIAVRLPALIGGGTCGFDVSPEFSEIVAILAPTAAPGGGITLAAGAVSVSPPSVAVSVISGTAFCDTLIPVATDFLATQLRTIAESRLRDELPQQVAPLLCFECSSGCPLRCAAPQ